MVSTLQLDKTRFGDFRRAIHRALNHPIVKIVIGVVIGLIIAVSVVVYKYPPFKTVGESMVPTLMPGDKLNSQRVSEISARGQIALFDTSDFTKSQRASLAKIGGQDTVYVKRVVGMPGDKLTMSMVTGKVTNLNGTPFPKTTRLNKPGFKLVNRDDKSIHIQAKRFLVDMGGYSHNTMHFLKHVSKLNREQKALYDKLVPKFNPVALNAAVSGEYATFTVPKGSYFVLSDNRAVGRDSRHFGFVPADALFAVVNEK